MIWWNNDYPWYAFHDEHPDYDYYAFVEYDVVTRIPFADLVGAVAAARADLVMHRHVEDPREWGWYNYTVHTYPPEVLQVGLTCLTIVSRDALALLKQRRKAMAVDPRIKKWPIAEAFVPTEAARAGLAVAQLGQFGRTTAYDWFPPKLDADVETAPLLDSDFLHPVLDMPRYVNSVLRYGANLRAYFSPDSQLHKLLQRCPPELWRPRLMREAANRFLLMKREMIRDHLHHASYVLARLQNTGVTADTREPG